MPPAWAQRHAAFLRDCIVSPAVCDHLGERRRAFAVPYPHALETAAGKRTVSLSLPGRLSHGPRQHAARIATLVDVARLVLHECIGTAPWAQRPWVTVWVGEGVERLGAAAGIKGDEPRRCPKRGAHAGGVKRQGGRHRGKVDHCQVGVCMGYGSRPAHAWLDFRLSLSADWASDQPRRPACHIPEAVSSRTRPEECRAMLALWGAQVPHGWGTGAAELGRHRRFRQVWRERGERSGLGGPCPSARTYAMANASCHPALGWLL